MVEFFRFIFSSFWVWLGFNLTFTIPFMYAVECAAKAAVGKAQVKAAIEQQKEREEN